MQGLVPEKVTRDAIAYVAFLDQQKAVDIKRGIGVQGYCMGVPSRCALPLRCPGA